MLSFLSKSPRRTRVANLSTIFFDDGRSSITFKSPEDHYLVINHLPPATARHGENHSGIPPPSCALDPPLHWHSSQAEYFHVLEGSALFYLGDGVTTASAGEIVTIPHQAFHTFRNASKTDDLVIEFVLDPRNRDRDEAFFRNAQTYRDDCRKAGMERSLFQVLMFNRAGNVALAVPGPAFIARTFGLMINFFGSLVGRWIFGYSYTYPEYYRPKDD